LVGDRVGFHLTQQGTRAKFDSAKNFTVRSRDKFDRMFSFKMVDVLLSGGAFADTRPAKKRRA